MSTKAWLSHYPAEVPETFSYPDYPIQQFLIDSATRFPKAAALDFLGKRMTYRAVLQAARRFANALVGLGVSKGDRVALMLPNCPQMIISYYGTLMTGAIVVMTNPLYSKRELEHQLRDSGASVIVTLDQLLKRVEQAAETVPLSRIIVTSIRDYLPFPLNVLYRVKLKKEGTPLRIAYDDRIVSFRRLLAEALAAPLEPRIDPSKDLALLQYTGGTTGLAKGVMLTHRNLVANTIQARLWFYKAQEGRERYLCVLPFFHVFGLTTLLHLGIYTAGTLILVPRFEIKQVLKTIRKKKPTIFPGAPTMYIAIINHAEGLKGWLSSIRICISGAAPLPQQVQEKFESMSGGKLIEGYGLTEASPVTHVNNIWERRKNGSIGIPVPDTEARIVRPDTLEDVAPGEIGELAVRGPQVMQGYWQKPGETEKVLKDGWLLTGDLGTMDDDGFCYILDRRKDLIIAGGYNVYPREVEDVLYEHPLIAEVAVAGVVDSYRGETVKAYIVLREGAKLGQEELRFWCRDKLAAYKIPKLFEFREALPKTMAGKVLRRKLVEEENERASGSGGGSS